jgi:prepilin-type N-terminal cleavage/methylation domain-containing protein
MRTGRAFTLVELVVVVLILGVLAAIAIPRISQGNESSRIRACQTNVDLLNSRIEVYYIENEKWPQNLNKLVKEYFPEGTPECPFGTNYEYDNDAHRVLEHTH